MTDKERILINLKSSKEINTMEVTDNWKQAFDAFNKATGHKMNVGHRCPKCFQMVLDWLQDVK